MPDFKIPGGIDYGNLRTGTLDIRDSDRRFYGQLQGGLDYLERGRGDATATGLPGAFGQTLGHMAGNRSGGFGGSSGFGGGR